MSSPVRSAFVSSNTGSGSASKGGIIRLTAEEETEAEERLLAYTRLPAGS